MKASKRCYAVNLRSYKTTAQSDNLENLQKRCKKIIEQTEDDYITFAIYDSQAYPQEKSRIGTYDSNGFTKYYH